MTMEHTCKRRGLRIFTVPYSHSVVLATAKVLQIVITEYLDPADLPQLPDNFAALPSQMQTLVGKLYKQLGPVMASCRCIELPGSFFQSDTCILFVVLCICLALSPPCASVQGTSTKCLCTCTRCGCRARLCNISS